MKQRLVLIIALSLMAKLTYCQMIDRYGINFGTSYSTQIWDHKLAPLNFDIEYKLGIQAFFQAEKDLGSLLALRTEFGYIQKGFKNNITLTSSDLNTVKTNRDNVILHDIAFDFGLKIKPLKTNYSPYIFCGFRCDYMISHNEIIIEDNDGVKINMYDYLIDDFNKFNYGGLIGFGIDINDAIYFEVDYNKNFTNNLDENGLSIRDNCYGVKIGLNINKLI